MSHKNNSPEQKSRWKALQKLRGWFPFSLPSRSDAVPFWNWNLRGQTPPALRRPFTKGWMRPIMLPFDAKGKHPGHFKQFHHPAKFANSKATVISLA